MNRGLTPESFTELARQKRVKWPDGELVEVNKTGSHITAAGGDCPIVYRWPVLKFIPWIIEEPEPIVVVNETDVSIRRPGHHFLDAHIKSEYAPALKALLESPELPEILERFK